MSSKKTKFSSFKKFFSRGLLVILSLVIATSSLSYFAKDKAGAANSAYFSHGRIIDDDVFTRTSTMTTSEIQAFLNSKGSDCVSNCLKDYRQNGKSAATIIREAALDYGINPQVIIVLLQKEQGIVTDTSPSSYSYKYATGYCVTDSGLCGNYWGFTKQVRKAAQLFRYIMDNPTQSNYPPGTRSVLYHPNRTCGSKSVKITTRATSALYHYTPYTPNKAALDNLYGTGNSCSAYGNRNFWRYFTDWFGSVRGSYRFIKCDDDYYLVESGIRRKRLLTTEARNVWGLEESSFIEGDIGCDYSAYDLALEDYAGSRNTGKKYFLDQKKAFWVSNQTDASSWNIGTLSTRPAPLLNGDTLNSLSVYREMPRLAKSANTNKVYLIDNGKRYYVEESENSFDSQWLRLVASRGQDIPIYLISGEVLSPITAGSGDITYAFRDSSYWYLFDGGEIHRIHPIYQITRWSNITSITGPRLSDSVVSTLNRKDTLKRGFRHSDKYYIVNGSGDLVGTTSRVQAKRWGVLDAPKISTTLYYILAAG